MFAAMCAVGLLSTAACSTDVQRFGQAGGKTQSYSPANVATAPLEPVQTGTVAPISSGQGYNSGQGYSTAGATGANPRLAAARRIMPGRYANSGTAPSTTSAPSASGAVRVGSGDTLYSVARSNGVSVEDLAAANDIRYPYSVRIGQTLRIPGAPRSVAAVAPARSVRSTGGTSHTVSAGDTLYGVARSYGVKVTDLAAANGLSNTSGVRIGQKLTIPGPGFVRQAAVGGPLEPDRARKTAAKQKVAKTIPVATPAATPVRTQVAAKSNASESIGPLPSPPTRAASNFRWPVRGRLISRFGPQSDGSRNDGINISVPAGTSVKASENGVVAYAGSELKGYGNLVLIRHTDDWVTAYAHNNEILVKRGDTVKRGQIIAKAGKSGSVTKPQVHFEVRKGAKAVDPLTYLEGA